MMKWTMRALCALALTTAAGSPTSGQQPATPAGPVGTISGRILTSENSSPLMGAQVTIEGTILRAVAGAEGRFAIRNVPVGTQTVRVQFIGFTPSRQVVNVTADAVATVTFVMKDMPYAINPMVVTALGITRSEKSLGYAVQTMSAAQIDRIP